MLVRPSHYDTSGITLKFIRPRRFGPIRELDFPACRRVNLIFRRAGEFSSVPVSSRSRDGIRYPPSWGSIHGKRSEEHTSELQSLMLISYAVFCLKKKNNTP